MNDYWLAFRIGGEGSSDRREHLLQGLRDLSDRQSWWDEAGSLILFRSHLSIEELRAAAEGMLDAGDFMLIGMLYFLRWEMIGKPDNDALFNTMRFLPGV